MESKLLEGQLLTVKVKIHEEHTVFNGHFPNFPVVPGVAMLQIIKNILEKHLQQTLFLKSSSSIKFLSLVNPHKENILFFGIHYTMENEVINVKTSTSFKDGRAVLKCNTTFVKNNPTKR
ncbi:MAG: 3-hydroxyacyl-ACP dehydratase [Gelidibacter sp.]